MHAAFHSLCASYEIHNSNINARFEEVCETYFAIHLDTGVITVIDQANLDREEIIPDRDTLRCYIEYNLGMRHAIVDIEILDLNDCTPHFFGLSQPHHLDVFENVALPTPLLLLQPTDQDKGANGTTQFNITSGNEGEFFSIALAEGDTEESTTNRILFLVKMLNFEALSNGGIFNLTITISDLAVDPLTLEQRVNIQVTDLEDDPPTFDMTSYVFSISENHPVGSSEGVFAHVSAGSDQSEGLVFYDICSNCDAGNYFGVNQVSGDLFLKIPIDYESLPPPKRFMFEIEASNRNTRQIQTTVVTVNVIDVNEHPPFLKCTQEGDKYFQASYSCGSGQNVNNSELYIQENTIPSRLFRFFVDDDDETTEFRKINRTSVDYQIVPEDNPFIVGFNAIPSGAIAHMVLDGTLDREKTPNFSVTLTVENLVQPTLRRDTTITIIVLDVNDNAPEFTQSEYQANVFEGSPDEMEVLRVEADDPDEEENGKVTYSITGVSEEVARDWFQISPADGVISIRSGSSLDYLRLGDGGSLTLTIAASDNGTEQMSSSATVAISILPSATFIPGSYQEYSSAEFNVLADSNGSFYLEFRSSEGNGLLAYQMSSDGAVFSVELQDGSVVASLGESHMADSNSDVSSDIWHFVHVQWIDNQVSVRKSVDST